MSKLLTLLQQRFGLMVSLPRNEVALARAAVEAGANCLKVHINCHHFASGTRFGSWQEEKSAILEILQAVTVPVGIVTGEEQQPSPADLEEIQSVGFDFWDLFARFTPPSHFDLSLARMVAVDSSWTPELMQALQSLGVQVIEGSIVPRSEYGTPLHLVDLANYLRLASCHQMPVLIPTQKAVEPDQVRFLKQSGAAGLTIGAIVTGLEEASLARATAGFAEAIARLG